jgi:hypothetical protein
MLAQIMAALVWIIANFVYGSMVRDGRRGFRRLAAFYLGWPGTFLSYLTIKETRRRPDPEVEARVRAHLELEEERDLLLEIRRDRARRIARSKGGDGEAAGEEA